MPAIRVMNWNIQQFSSSKASVPGMMTALARTISAQNVDLVVVLEMMSYKLPATLVALTAALRALDGNPWTWVRSYPTGGEYYAFLIRNPNLIRPLRYADNPNVPVPDRTDGDQHPFNNLNKLQWTTWPNNVWGAALPYPIPGLRPRIGTCDVYASRDKYGSPERFRGQSLALDGYSLGRGFRLPCLAVFHIHTPLPADYYLPIVACHYGAVRSGRNHLAQGQVEQLRLMHIAQLFNSNPAAAAGIGQSGYLYVDGAWVRVQEIVYTGDFNLDFLENDGGAGATFRQLSNHAALVKLTPTVQGGGSAGPAAVPGVAAAPPPAPFPGPYPPGPRRDTIPDQSLKAALTSQGSILKAYDPAAHPPDTRAIRGAAFDNFFYGGTRLNTAARNPATNDSAEVVNVPDNIIQPHAFILPAVPPPWAVDLSQVRRYYRLRRTKGGDLPAAAPLSGIGPLTVDARWIGARFLSDHLPVVLQFDCP